MRKGFLLFILARRNLKCQILFDKDNYFSKVSRSEPIYKRTRRVGGTGKNAALTRGVSAERNLNHLREAVV